jgi:type VI protein secretion system component VasK
MSFDRRLTIGVILAVVVQSAGVLLWAGAAAERVSTLEEQVREGRPVAERLARVEAELGAMRTQLDRIERKLEVRDAP